MDTTFGTLTAAGAQLLRDARDYFIAHPDRLDFNQWDTGRCFCIAGCCHRLLTQTLDAATPQINAYTENLYRITRLLGFTSLYCAPLMGLFAGSIYNSPEYAAKRINDFLWKYGYPATAIVAPVAEVQQHEEEAVLACA